MFIDFSSPLLAVDKFHSIVKDSPHTLILAAAHSHWRKSIHCLCNHYIPICHCSLCTITNYPDGHAQLSRDKRSYQTASLPRLPHHHNNVLRNHHRPRRAPHPLHPPHDPLNRRHLLNDRSPSPNAPLPHRRRPSNQTFRRRRQRHLYVATCLEGNSTYHSPTPEDPNHANTTTTTTQSQAAPEPSPS